MSTFTIEELPIPATIDDPAWAAFVETVNVRNRVQELLYGPEAGVYSAEELLPNWTDPYAPKRLIVARVDGRIVARSILEYATEGGADTCALSVEVDPDFRGRGVGTALANRLDTLALEMGRPVAQAWVAAVETPGKRLTASTGIGSVPVADAGVRFLSSRGWALEQVERMSRLALPVEPAALETMVSSAQQASGDDYRVHTWIDRTPERWLNDMVVLLERMSTDAPTGGMASDEQKWTVERILQEEERQANSPRSELIAAVEHVPSGTLAGYTQLSVPAEIDRAVSQEDTIVIREHRGHRLGMLLKVANIAHLAAERAGHPAITTFNAEENRHMLSVNESVGFVAAAYEGAWQKMLSL